MTQIAVISDVHGNRWALEATLREIDARGITRIVNLGDCVYGPLDPGRTAAMLISREIPTVRGNEDRLIIDAGDGGETAAMVAYARSNMTAEQLEWLAALPFTRDVEGVVRMYHGTPERDDEYLLQVVEACGPCRRSPEEVAERLMGVEAPIVLCGHDHTPGVVALRNGRTVVNPGSVGLQAYEDDVPMPHVMATRSPHARFSILSGEGMEWSVEPVAVAYDWEAAAKAAEERGRPDWAAWLRTGKAR